MSYALPILAFLMTLAALFKENISARYKLLAIGVIVVIAFLTFIVSLAQENQRQRVAWQSKWSGLLQSASRDTSATAPVLSLGGGESKLIYGGDPTKPLFDLAGEPLFINLVDGEARLSVVVRDDSGIFLAGIRENEWSVARQATLDRNFNRDTLEVVDRKGEVVFQVQIKGAEVRLAGRFYTRDGQGPMSIGPWIHDIEGREGQTLFRYPSEQHPGELARVKR